MLSKGDKILFRKLIKRDEKALFEFYCLYKTSLSNFLSKQLDDRDDLEEVLQDSYLAFFEALRDFRGKSSLKTFLFAIAKRKAIDKLRKKKVKKVLFSRLPQRFVESMASILLDDEIDKRILAARIEKALSRLPNDYVKILRLKYWEDYKVAEISDKINMSLKRLKVCFFGLEKLL